MKKTLLAILIAGSAMAARAQSTHLGIKGGVNFSNLSINQNGSSQNYSGGNLTAFSAGVFADMRFSSTFSVQPALLYSGKGYKYKETISEVESGVTVKGIAEQTLTIAYLHVPVHFVYNAPTNFGKLFIGAGPFGSVALKAHSKGFVDLTGTSGSNTVKFNEDIDEDLEFGTADGVKRFDAGASGLAGFQFNNGLQFSVNYDLGLVDIAGVSDDAKAKTRVLGLSVGFVF